MHSSWKCSHCTCCQIKCFKPRQKSTEQLAQEKQKLTEKLISYARRQGYEIARGLKSDELFTKENIIDQANKAYQRLSQVRWVDQLLDVMSEDDVRLLFSKHFRDGMKGKVYVWQ